MLTSDFVKFWPSAVSQDGNLSFIRPHQTIKPNVIRIEDESRRAQLISAQNASINRPRKELSSSLWYKEARR